jgi:hypothetical protein
MKASELKHGDRFIRERNPWIWSKIGVDVDGHVKALGVDNNNRGEKISIDGDEEVLLSDVRSVRPAIRKQIEKKIIPPNTGTNTTKIRIVDESNGTILKGRDDATPAQVMALASAESIRVDNDYWFVSDKIYDWDDDTFCVMVITKHGRKE